ARLARPRVTPMIVIPRGLARAPIALYRVGLGGLLTTRMVLLEHRGRRSGQIRQVVLETLSVDHTALHLISGYGWRAQWLRNIEADPRVRVTCGWSRPRAGRATILPPAAGVAVLEEYRRRHPIATRLLAPALDLPELEATEPIPEYLAQDHPVVRVDLRTSHTH